MCPSPLSHLPEKESQQGQQQQSEQDGQNNDPPWHSSLLGFKPLREHCQSHLGKTNTVAEDIKSVNYSFKCFFIPIYLYDAHKTDVSVCTTLPSAFEFSCNGVNNHDCFGLPVSQHFAEPCSLFYWQHSERPSLSPPHDVTLKNPV